MSKERLRVFSSWLSNLCCPRYYRPYGFRFSLYLRESHFYLDVRVCEVPEREKMTRTGRRECSRSRVFAQNRRAPL